MATAKSMQGSKKLATADGKGQKEEKVNLPIPDFQDVDSSAVEAAQAAMQGNFSKPLKVPEGASESTDAKGRVYSRFTENIVVKQAYRNVTRTGLLDVTVQAKIRQSEDNEGATVWFHYYQNLSVPVDELEEGHVNMNQRSLASIASLLKATGFMPTSNTLKAALLSKMFPSKGQPGSASPLIGKTAIANITQTAGPKKDKNGKVEKDADGETLIERRDQAESFLPEDN